MAIGIVELMQEFFPKHLSMGENEIDIETEEESETRSVNMK